MILVDWFQNLLIASAVHTHQGSRNQPLDVLEDQVSAALEA